MPTMKARQITEIRPINKRTNYGKLWIRRCPQRMGAVEQNQTTPCWSFRGSNKKDWKLSFSLQVYDKRAPLDRKPAERCIRKLIKWYWDHLGISNLISCREKSEVKLIKKIVIFSDWFLKFSRVDLMCAGSRLTSVIDSAVLLYALVHRELIAKNRSSSY